jgi:oligopeptide transport system ATP-binding protein
LTDALAELRDLRMHYRASGAPIRAVDGVDLRLERGETLALVGESGCGKSTLARAMMGLEKPTAGTVLFEGTVLPAFPARARRGRSRDLQMVFQDPDASLNPRMTIQAAVGEPLDLHERLSSRDREARVNELMRDVGLDPALRLRYPHELSGGQRQRVCIARALAVRPKLLVCDEAVSALDVSVQAQILNLLLELKRSFGLSYLFITHDLRVVRHIADRVMVMYLGQIMETGETDRIFAEPAHPYTRVLLASVPVIGRERREPTAIGGEPPSPANPPPGCRFQTRCPSVMARCRTEQPPLYDLGGRQARCFLVEEAARVADAPST